MSSCQSRPTSHFNIFIQLGSPKAPAQLNALTCAMMRNFAWRPRFASMPLGIRPSTSTSRSSTALSSLQAYRIAKCGMTRIDAMVCSAMSITNANRAAAALSFLLPITGACHSWVTTVPDGTQPESITRNPYRSMLKWALIMKSSYRSSRRQRRRGRS